MDEAVDVGNKLAMSCEDTGKDCPMPQKDGYIICANILALTGILLVRLPYVHITKQASMCSFVLHIFCQDL